MMQLMNALKKAQKREGERNMGLWALPITPCNPFSLLAVAFFK
jgi:hypothetical protein